MRHLPNVVDGASVFNGIGTGLVGGHDVLVVAVVHARLVLVLLEVRSLVAADSVTGVDDVDVDVLAGVVVADVVVAGIVVADVVRRVVVGAASVVGGAVVGAADSVMRVDDVGDVLASANVVVADVVVPADSVTGVDDVGDVLEGADVVERAAVVVGAIERGRLVVVVEEADSDLKE